MNTKTMQEAKAVHPTAEVVEVIDRADADGEPRQAIYVWDSEEDAANDDGANAVAVYWLG